MSENNLETKLIKCFDYGVLWETIYEDEKTWILSAEGYEYTHMNCTFIETLNELSMEGWDLVCQGERGYILRRPAEKEELQPCDDDEEVEDDCNLD